ncbi:MAG: hypothetical protein LUC49_00675 [Prevotella sp.]|nr:hypothetical protein [Prevotella sp.]
MKHKTLILICTVVLSMTAISAFAGRKGTYCIFSEDANQRYEDDNVVVLIINRELIIRNKTNHIIYLNKETSFAYLNDVPTCLFSNAITTTSTSQGSGTNVNLGGVARAMGVGGGLGALMSGIDVGSNQTQGSSTTIVEQKIVTIAPQSAYSVYFFGNIRNIVRDVGAVSHRLQTYIDPKTKAETKLKKGAAWQFNDYSESPVRLKGIINYFADENAPETVQVTVSNYVSNIIVDEMDVNKAQLIVPYEGREWQAFNFYGWWSSPTE